MNFYYYVICIHNNNFYLDILVLSLKGMASVGRRHRKEHENNNSGDRNKVLHANSSLNSEQRVGSEGGEIASPKISEQDRKSFGAVFPLLLQKKSIKR